MLGSQIGRNMEVDVDDLIVKTKKKDDLLIHPLETLNNLWKLCWGSWCHTPGVRLPNMSRPYLYFFILFMPTIHYFCNVFEVHFGTNLFWCVWLHGNKIAMLPGKLRKNIEVLKILEKRLC